MDGSTVLKYFLSLKSTLSHGGLPRRQVKPPDQPVAGSTVGIGVVGDAEDLGELQVPVEEAVVGLEPGDLRSGGRRDRRDALLAQRPEDPVDDGGGCVLGLAPDERGAPGVGDLVGVLVLRGLLPVAVCGGLAVHVAQGAVWRVGDRGQLRGEVLVGLREDEAVAEELVLVRVGRWRWPGQATQPTAASSPSTGLNALSGMPRSISAGVAPISALPHLMWASRKPSGLPGSSASSQSETLASSTAIGFTSTP